VPRTGHIIGFAVGYGEPLTQLGPIARNVEDLFPLLKTIAGSDEYDPAVVDMPLLDPRNVEISSLRIAFHTDNGVMPAQQEVKKTVEVAAKVMADAGATVEQECPKPLAKLADIWAAELTSDGGETADHILETAGTKQRHRFLDYLKEVNPLPGDEFNRFLRRWQQFRAEMHYFVTRFDAILCPVSAFSSLPVDYPLGELCTGFTYTYAYNLTGWPAAVVRAGTNPDGVPIGVQIVARPWREDICLAVAGHLERSLGGWKRSML
jgi:amidase